MELTLWNILSVSLLFFMYAPLVLAALAKDDERTRHITAFIGTMATFVISEGLKLRVIGSSESWMKRPAAAYDCNGFCNDGRQGGEPGFPSSHAAISTYLAASYWRDQPVLVLGGWAAIIYSRIAKSCHTWLQVGAGTLLGLLIAYASRTL
jgi:membrane-associated phospholipid phosphatase